MVYKVTKQFEYKGKIYLPGQIVKIPTSEIKAYANKIEKLGKYTKVIK